MTTVNSLAKHIGLNAHLLNLSGNYRSAGINWYIYHLLRNLPRASDLDYTVFTSEPRAHDTLTHLAITRSRLPTHIPIARIVWEQFIQPFEIRRAKLDLLHALAFAGPRLLEIPWVVTVYDLSFIRYPQSFNTANRVYLTWAVRDAVRRANRVIAISASTKRDLVEMFGVAENKIDVVYCGTDPLFSPEANPAQRRPRMPEKMILYVGTLEPRKNVAQLIRAFARVKREAHMPHKLVLIGARGWKHTDVDAAIEQENIRAEVILPGYVPTEDLPSWYRAADLFVYPTRYEGFGMPALEAMACGTPVVTTNASSLPEVVGDAALQVAPDDLPALADAMTRALTDSTLREQMRARGLAQAKQFSWTRTGNETAAIYRSVLAPGAHHA